MTASRARQLWRTRSPFGEIAVTAEEDVFVKQVWKSMPGYSRWIDALLSIANSTT
jgi:hypothetical protein